MTATMDGAALLRQARRLARQYIRRAPPTVTIDDLVGEAVLAVLVRRPQGAAFIERVMRIRIDACVKKEARLARKFEQITEDIVEPIGSTSLNIEEAARSLPFDERAAVVLRFASRKTQAEIAHALGVSRQTVGNLLKNGLTRLLRKAA